MPNRGQPVNTTYSNGLNVRDFWTTLFRANEAAARARAYTAVKTDTQLVLAVRTAFPDRWESKLLRDAVRNRAAYNRGDWQAEGCKPAAKSHRYDRDADDIVWQVTARGRKLIPLSQPTAKELGYV